MTFIENVVNDLLSKNLDFSHTRLVIPGKRPIVFIKQAFEKKQYNGILPEFITIEEFTVHLSELIKTDSIPLWLEAYRVWREHIHPEEKIEDFLKWIPTVLKDFDNIDAYTAEPLKVFEHLTSAERIENWGENMLASEEEKLYKKNIRFWEHNTIFYQLLKAELESKNLGTKGMISQRAVQNISRESWQAEDLFVFIGLNALTPKEEEIIRYLSKNTRTLFYWDSDEYYMKGETQEAGMFLREYKKWSVFDGQGFNWIGSEFSDLKDIKTVSVSQDISMVKYATRLLQNIPDEEISQTAVVLCDESLLPVLMEYLPENIKKVNITMGYPLKNSSISMFFKQVFQLQIFREKNKTAGFYYKDVLHFLEISKNINSVPDNFYELSKEIKTSNKVFLEQEYIVEKLLDWELLFVFKKYENPLELIENLSLFCWDKFYKTSEEFPVLRENFLRFKELFSVLHSQLTVENIVLDFEMLQFFFKNILNNETIDFIGEPLEGLQIMGLLETRLLSFKNLILLGVNEGIIPAGRTENSFIPFDIKRDYHINTFLENDAIYAYHFYQLLQHGKDITLIYNNFTEGLNSGEKSRFISQLEFESPHKIQEFVADYEGKLQSTLPMNIEKTPFVIEKIEHWLKKGIAPTNLTSYIYDPIQFYLQKILNIRESDEVLEEVSNLEYGNLIHNTLERVYRNFEGKYLEAEELEKMQTAYKDYLFEYIKENFNTELFDKGMNYLQKLLAEKTIEKIILRDLEDVQAGHKIFIKALEEEISTQLEIEQLGVIKLHGYVDRWDIYDGTDRIVDYKTSSFNGLKVEGDKLEKIRENKDFKFYIQLIFYAYIMLKGRKTKELKVGIWTFKKPFKGLQTLSISGSDIIDDSKIDLYFSYVSDIIKEIADYKKPFVSNH